MALRFCLGAAIGTSQPAPRMKPPCAAASAMACWAARATAAGVPRYRSEDGVLFDKSGSTLLQYPCGRSGNTHDKTPCHPHNSTMTIYEEFTATVDSSPSSSEERTTANRPRNLARIFYPPLCSHINTVASARWANAFTSPELFQQFAQSGEKPLKRLTVRAGSIHRAKASVLIRGPTAWCEIPGLDMSETKGTCGGGFCDSGRPGTQIPTAERNEKNERRKGRRWANR